MSQQSNALQKYYNKLVGMTIKKVVVLDDGFDDADVVLCVSNKKGEKFLLHLLSDEEGDATGFIEIEPWDNNDIEDFDVEILV